MRGKASKFLTKPVEVEAYQWDGSNSELYYIVGWITENGGTAWIQEGHSTQSSDMVRVETKQGSLLVVPKSWVICEARGRFQILRPDAFENAYSPAPQEGDAPEPEPGTHAREGV